MKVLASLLVVIGLVGAVAVLSWVDWRFGVAAGFLIVAALGAVGIEVDDEPS